MSRPTDTERGARIALDAALFNNLPQLFPADTEVQALWSSIFDAASDQLRECAVMRSALAR